MGNKYRHHLSSETYLIFQFNTNWIITIYKARAALALISALLQRTVDIDLTVLPPLRWSHSSCSIDQVMNTIEDLLDVYVRHFVDNRSCSDVEYALQMTQTEDAGAQVVAKLLGLSITALIIISLLAREQLE